MPDVIVSYAFAALGVAIVIDLFRAAILFWLRSQGYAEHSMTTKIENWSALAFLFIIAPMKLLSWATFPIRVILRVVAGFVRSLLKDQNDIDIFISSVITSIFIIPACILLGAPLAVCGLVFAGILWATGVEKQLTAAKHAELRLKEDIDRLEERLFTSDDTDDIGYR